MASDHDLPADQQSETQHVGVSAPAGNGPIISQLLVPDEAPQSPYWQQPVMGSPLAHSYERPSGYGYIPPHGVPLPLGQAMRGLFKQYARVLSRPGVHVFEEEQGKATWSVIWIQLLLVIVLGTIAGFAHTIIFNSFFGGGMFLNAFFYSAVFIIPGLLTGDGLTLLVSTLVAFFVVSGLQYVLARIVGGNGYFKQQGYNYLLFYVPLTLLGIVLQWIPFFGLFAMPLLWIYQLVLNIFSIMAAHRLSGGKASVVVLAPIVVIAALVLLLLGMLIVSFEHRW